MNDAERAHFLARLMTAEEFYGRQQWRKNHMTTITQGVQIMADKSKAAPPLAQVNKNATKEDRAKAIAEAAAKKKANGGDPPPAKPRTTTKPKVEATTTKPKADKVDKADKPKKAADDVDMLSVSDVARELGIDPKRARAKLRAGGQGAEEGRYPKVKRGSREYDNLVSLLSPAATDDEASDESEEEGDEE